MHPSKKIVASLAHLENVCRNLRKKGEVVVLTSGCFDLLHGGHLEYICEAGKHGYLVVGINSDAFVKRLKGENRPIRDQQDRAFTMAGFYPVKHVVIFEYDHELISAVNPHVYIASLTSHVLLSEDKGRFSLLESLGTEIVEIGSRKTDSTTSIIQRAAVR